MLSESLSFAIIIIFIVQSSILWASLTLIPLSIILILTTINQHSNHGIIALLYIIVFIGGLLVLLVSVTSLLSYEDVVSLNNIESLLIFFILIYFVTTTIESKLNVLIIWPETQGSIFLISLIILLTALSVISWQCLFYNSLTRRN